jgi:hypothetical protein
LVLDGVMMLYRNMTSGSLTPNLPLALYYLRASSESLYNPIICIYNVLNTDVMQTKQFGQ